METNKTFTIIKPGAVSNDHTGAIIGMINEAGFTIVSMKFTRLSKEEAMDFYSMHKDRPFYDELTSFMSSGPIVAAILKKDNAVNDFRKFIGDTNPDNAAEGTIRKLYAQSMSKNAIHGSDSNDNALIEGSFFFSKREQFE